MSKKITSFFSRTSGPSTSKKGEEQNENPAEHEIYSEPDNTSSSEDIFCSDQDSHSVSNPKRQRLEATQASKDIVHDASSSKSNDNARVVPAPISSIALDIGIYIGKTIDDRTKRTLLKNHWSPPVRYEFPFSVHRKKGKDEKRYLKQAHLDSFSWAVYSEALKGIFCKYCFLFAISGSDGRNPLGVLVKTPLVNFSKLLGKDGALSTHEQHVYHKDTVKAAKNFLNAYEKPETAVVNQVVSQRMNQIKQNRNRIAPIIESIIFLGRQNIPFRGHRDHGGMDEHCINSNSIVNEGNFRELIKFKIKSGDVALRDHLKEAGANATYISPETQNQLIGCCGEVIREKILARIIKSKFYSVLFDETTDLSHKSQMTVLIRFIDGLELREDFLEFNDLHETNYATELATVEPSLTGQVIGKSVGKLLESFKLDLLNCVGIGTDGCSVMSSVMKGAVAEIQKVCTNAVWSPCYNHGFNLMLSKSSQVKAIRNCMGTIGECVNFFNFPKRNHVLTQILGHQLVSLCETRWVEQHDAVLMFLEDLKKVVEALEAISEWNDQTTASKANSLLTSVTSCEFIVALYSLANVFSYTTAVSQLLQKQDLCVERAAEVIENLRKRLQQRRDRCESEFQTIYSEAVETMDQLNIEPSMPRITGRQTGRANTPSKNPEEYYRRTIFIPMLDNILCDLSTRFTRNTLNCFHLFSLLPKNIVTKSDEALSEAANILQVKYGKIIDCRSEMRLKGELSMWQGNWQDTESSNIPVPKTFLEALDKCDEDLYPNVRSLLKILGTLPVSVASAERSFSCLKRLKTWLRTRMGQDRLTGLALLNINREMEISIDEIIDCFGKGKRRLEFVI